MITKHRVSWRSAPPAKTKGVPFIEVPLSTKAVLSGTFAEGTPFAIENRFSTGAVYDQVADGVFKLKAMETTAPGPAMIKVPADAAPSGLRQTQLLILGHGGELEDHFTAGWGSSVEVLGWHIGRGFERGGTKVKGERSKVTKVTSASTPRVDPQYSPGPISTFFYCERACASLRVYLKNNLHLAFGHQVC